MFKLRYLKFLTLSVLFFSYKHCNAMSIPISESYSGSNSVIDSYSEVRSKTEDTTHTSTQSFSQNNSSDSDDNLISAYEMNSLRQEREDHFRNLSLRMAKERLLATHGHEFQTPNNLKLQLEKAEEEKITADKKTDLATLGYTAAIFCPPSAIVTMITQVALAMHAEGKRQNLLLVEKNIAEAKIAWEL